MTKDLYYVVRIESSEIDEDIWIQYSKAGVHTNNFDYAERYIDEEEMKKAIYNFYKCPSRLEKSKITRFWIQRVSTRDCTFLVKDDLEMLKRKYES